MTRPILFSPPMVLALLAGRKTQERRRRFRCEVGDILWEREFEDESVVMRSVGKKTAGRLLDGVEHNEFPEVRP